MIDQQLLNSILTALVTVTLPVGVLTLLVFFWFNRKGIVIESAEQRAVNKPDEPAGKPNDFIHGKWVRFGGGFYGMLALITYLWVEVQELIGLTTNFNFTELTVSSIIFTLIIKFILASIFNLVTALTWPFYWANQLTEISLWMAFISAYLGYWLGESLAKKLVR